VKPLTASRLAAAMGLSADAASLWVAHVNTALGMCGCTTPEHVAMWIAQVGHESEGLTHLVENLNYSVDALLTKFGRHRISEEDARKFGRDGARPANQREIALRIYGGGWGLDNLGNRPGTDDGWRYIAHGPIGITGRANHIACGQMLGLDLEHAPELLCERGTGAQSTVWFWRRHNLTRYNGDVLNVTKRINGGTNGLTDRQARYDRALSVLSGTAEQLVRIS
jgi:putative chitinase